MPHSEFLAAALDAARAADDVVRHYYQRNLKITIKADKSPVTEAEAMDYVRQQPASAEGRWEADFVMGAPGGGEVRT